MMAIIGGCEAASDDSPPPVPAELVYRDELPLGDAMTARMNRAATAARDLLEPRWGPLESRIFLLPVARRADFATQTAQTLSPGWQEVNTVQIGAHDSTLLIFAKGDRMLAYLLLDQASGDYYPIMRFIN